MAYKSIRFYNFRNLADEEVELSNNVYYLVGENGAGKSSFIEALYLLSYGSSFREKNLEHCLRKQDQPFSITGSVRQQDQFSNIQVQYDKAQNQAAGKKQIVLNGKRMQDRKELLHISPGIVFAPGDIVYINGSPRDKRQFIDQTISLVDPHYVDLSRNYARNLAQRNWILKNKQTALLPTYTLQMVEIGLEIQRSRKQHIAGLSRIFSELFQHVSNFNYPVSIEYQPSWQHIDDKQNAGEAVQSCLEYIEQRQQRDLLLGSSQSGPHRDRLLFSVSPQSTQNGQQKTPEISTKAEAGTQDFTKLASTGQLRLAALALKSAQASYLQKRSDNPGILLLDDVLLEMDSTRRKLFLACLPDYQQVFFTLLPDEDYKSYPFSDYQVLQLKHGKITQSDMKLP
ncbi:DNA replication and repair protein RecF [Candidatus Haliotispira prima]|uniref:DNA replication and repair protein RecF n=1 Tax=Candidatus Haliotispira prima TaxID=3034016 RepID=A0ABY8MG47_9SPIO|nr:DNA replication and repair protein RecF [Candidatus Haliotispira prima]WGK68982.1 DNA replication and repair protein RecF [Candidatus Haliotispira prima]